MRAGDGWRMLALPLAALALAGCDNPDTAIACSMVLQGQWIKAPSTFGPQGVRTRRLSDEDRARVGDSRQWRTLEPGQEFNADRDGACGGPAHGGMRELAVSHDGQWARAEFAETYRAETCLARREGDGWQERECDITMIADPF